MKQWTFLSLGRILGVIAILCIPLTAFTQTNNSDITIVDVLMTGNSEDNIRACDCPRNPLGGLLRTATYMNQMENHRDHVLAFHTGDFFKPETNPRLHSYILRALGIMGFDGVLIGDADFCEGDSFLHEYEGDVPFINSNIYYEGEPLGEPYRIYHVGNYSIGVFGVLDPNRFMYADPSKIAHTEFKDPTETAQAMVELLEPQVDAIICLSHLGLRMDQRLARDVPGIDLILGGDTRRVLETPTVVGSCRIVQAAYEGKQLIHVRMFFRDGELTSQQYHAEPLDYAYQDDPMLLEFFQQYYRGRELPQYND